MSAPFRITQKTVRSVSYGQSDFKNYLERLIKLIPTEIISLYIIGRGIIEEDYKLLLVWTIFCLGGVVLVRIYGTSNPTKNIPPQLPAVFIASISYLVWVYSMGDIFVTFGLYSPKLSSLIVLAWTFIVPYIYTGEP